MIVARPYMPDEGRPIPQDSPHPPPGGRGRGGTPPRTLARRQELIRALDPDLENVWPCNALEMWAISRM